jgi:diguanylate cyclase (GGDEF)-like protein
VNDLAPLDGMVLGPLIPLVSDGIAVAAAHPWRLVYVSPALANWLGNEAAELRGKPLEELFATESRATVLRLAELVVNGTRETAVLKSRLEVNNRSNCEVDVRLCSVVGAGQELLGLVIRRDPPDAAPSRERRDPLTGLPDREFLLLRLATLLHSKRLVDRQFAVLFIDLDNFKLVNDVHGHLVGDRVLCEAARRLVGSVRDGDHVVRFGGDEFVVLVEGVTEPTTIDSIITRIHAALAKPIALAVGEFTLSLSIGMALSSSVHHLPEDVLREADRAMYAAKRGQPSR